ncbi:major facilitator superfamily domain-containing protein [Morchella snyderi]|nr:major facilitator superfamily domain-containing protein [Morchella snyderi]
MQEKNDLATDPERNANTLVSASSSEYTETTKFKDPHDPLQWSWKKKHLILVAICYMTFMTDFLAGYGVPMIIPQGKEWGISSVDASRSLSGNTFMQGFGSLVAVPFAQRYGTLPVMFWSTLMTCFMTIACASCPTWIGFIAVRVLQGFFAASAQVLGLTVIQDIFYFEEHARKIGIWGWSILIGPYFGPFLSSMILHNLHWRESFWIVVGIVGFGLLLVIFLMEETTYDRVVPENNPPQAEGRFKRKLFALVGITGHRMKGRPSLCQGTWELVMVFVKPQFYMLFIYHGITFMWSVGINGTLILFLVPASPKGYGFGSIALGLIYFAPMTAVVIGELWGHFFNDALQLRSIKRNKGIFEPESRLWALYFSVGIMCLGLILLGVGLDRLWHWGFIAFFWGLFIFAIMTSTVTISAYVLDCFPQQSAAASALLNFTRVLFGFTVVLFQTKWSTKVGADWSFSTQAIICAAVFAIVPIVQKYGKGWRMGTDMSPDVINVKVEK